MPRYSHSRIECFENCPKQYEFRYILKTEGQPSTIAQFVGNRVHESLERLYKDVSMTRLPTLEQVLEGYRESWDEAFAEEQPVVIGEYTAEEHRAVGEKALADYYARYHPFDQGTTAGLELQLSIEVGDGQVLVGFIDRLVSLGEGRWEIHDYKTANKLPTQAQADADRQLALYQLGIQQMYSEVREVELVWHYVKFDAEVRSRRTPEELEALRLSTLARIATIESTQVFRPNESGLCDWCEYKALCPLFAHETSLSSLSPEELAEEPVVALVDRYAELCGRLSELKHEKESLEEQLRARALSQGLDALYGTEQRVKVFRRESVSVPGKGEPKREELERALAAAGLLDELSVLDTRALAKALEDGALPRDVSAVIRPLVETKETARLSLSRRSGGSS